MTSSHISEKNGRFYFTGFLKAAVFALISIFSLPAFADRIGFEGYTDLTIDFPEGFYLTDRSTDGKSFQLANSEYPVNAIVKLYSQGKYGSSQRALDDTISKLKLKASSQTVSWRNQTCTVSSISGTIGTESITGYAAAAVLPWDKGIIFFMDWCAQNKKSEYDCVLVSLIDSLCIDTGSYFEGGIMTQWKYPYKDSDVPVELDIDGKTINTFLKGNDALGSHYLIEREYEVLCLYAKSSKWKEAWQRYYRMIFRDSYKRLERAAFDIYNTLLPECTDETDLAQKLLTWTQNFKYEREQTKSDFASLPSILLGGGSDCDSRSMLLAVLLSAMNQDAVIFVSSAYSHAMAGFVSTHPGHSFTVDGKSYLMGETTAKGLTWGKISQNMDNQSNWITVTFP